MLLLNNKCLCVFVVVISFNFCHGFENSSVTSHKSTSISDVATDAERHDVPVVINKSKELMRNVTIYAIPLHFNQNIQARPFTNKPKTEETVNLHTTTPSGQVKSVITTPKTNETVNIHTTTPPGQYIPVTTTPYSVDHESNAKENISEDQQQNDNPLVVNIRTGLIKGRESKTVDGNKLFRAFQGIPYAEPPVGELRFSPPRPPKKWNGTLIVQKDEHKCIQDIDLSGSEDCLYLNVFTPKVQTASHSAKEEEHALLPVMVWIYGGYFYRGSSKEDKFGPDYFLDEDVIVVTFNYRLGVFGFLSTEDYTAPGNWGLKDQILALQWVQENIDRFGGDPEKVIIFGESAGSACISYLTQTELAKGLFRGAIMESGTSLNPWSYSRSPRSAAFTIGKLLDINTVDSQELIKQLRNIEAKTLHAVSTSIDLGETILHNPLDGLLFAPTLEVPHRGAVVVKHSHESLRNGDFNRVPIIVGFNSQEGIPFVNVINYIRPYLLTYDVFSTRLVPADMNIRTNLQKVFAALLIRNKYFGLRPITLSTKALVQFVTDDQFARPTTEYAEVISKYTPTYFYIFSYEGPLGVKGRKRELPGVGHGEELHYIWDKDDNIQNIPESDVVTRRRLVKLWTNFAKTLNPTPAHEELLQNITWPQANIRGLLYLDIGKELKLDSDFKKYNIRFWKQIYQALGKPPFTTF